MESEPEAAQGHDFAAFLPELNPRVILVQATAIAGALHAPNRTQVCIGDVHVTLTRADSGKVTLSRFGRKTQHGMSKRMLSCISVETPEVAKRQFFDTVHRQLLPHDPSLSLQAEIAHKYLASVAELGVDQLPEEKQAGAPSASTFRLWRPYWVRLHGVRKAIGCVCVHHATHEMLSVAISTLRKNCHASRNTSDASTECRFGSTCNCRCSSECLLRASVCETDPGVLSCIACIKQECAQCGLEKILVCPRTERNNFERCTGKVRLMLTHKHAFPGHDEKSKIEPTTVEKSLQVLFVMSSDVIHYPDLFIFWQVPEVVTE